MEQTPQSRKRMNFEHRVENLSKASARKVRLPEPYRTVEAIDWNTEGWEVTPGDTRWVAPDNFDIGTSQWYQELPVDKQAEIGRYRIAQIARVGGEFEAGLIIGMTKLGMSLPSDDPNKQYMLIESEEEHRHMRMFDKMITKIGVEPAGAPDWFRTVANGAGIAAYSMPVGFMSLILMGEEPIDTMQKKLVAIADAGREIHPMVDEVMRTHIAEEARHITFADEYVERGFEKLNRVQQALFAAAVPRVQKLGIDVILKPSKQAITDMGIPKQVAKEVWWNSDYGQQTIYDTSKPMYERAKRLGIAEHRLARAAWRNLGHGE